MAMVNAKLYPRLDTVFLYTRPKYEARLMISRWPSVTGSKLPG